MDSHISDHGHPSQPRPAYDGLERLLQVLVVGLAILSSVLVDLGRGTWAFSPVLIASSVTALIVTDIYRWLHIPRSLVGIITLGAVFPLAQGFLRYDTASQLTEIGRLLTVWLSVFFFQIKTPRIYGSLIVLSLLMVVVAAILNDGLEFALLLLLYQFGGLLCLVLLYVHSGQLALRTRFASAQVRVSTVEQEEAGMASQLLGRPPVAYQEPSSLPERGRMWDRGLTVHLLGMVFTTIFFTAGFFYAIPRVGEGGWSAARDRKLPVVGFGTSIHFRELEKILESREIAMRVTFSDARTRQVLPPMLGELYLQGRALAFYDVDVRGQVTWRSYEQGSGRPLFPIDPNFEGEIVRTDFLLQPSRDHSLYFVPAPYSGPGTPQSLRFDRYAGRVVRPSMDETATNKQYRYSLYSTGFRSRAQMPVLPVLRFDPRLRQTYYEIGAQEKAGLLEFERERFPYLSALAERLLQESKADESRIYKARVLQNHFKDTQLYHYSLDLSQLAERRRNDVDPIEDFVANHRTGHCAYFASALTLMLRSVGIPARVVIGFAGGEYNNLGGYYQFRQNDAHAWVEAYLEPDQVPEGLTSQAIQPGGAAWYRLDPTPASSEEANLIESTGFDKVLDYAQMIWNDYVLEMNSERQQAAGVFGSSAEASGFVEQIPFIGPGWAMLKDWWRNGPGAFLAAWQREGYWNWRGGVVASVLAAVCVALASLAKALQGRWNKWRTARAGDRPVKVPRVEFYRRLELLLKPYGLVRQEGQTQREFVRSAAEHLRASHAAAHSQLEARLEALVAQFYRVRFGRATLTPDETQEVQRLLQECSASLNGN